MGYQESYIYTDARDVEENKRDIEKILHIFQKYNVRCVNDGIAECTIKLHFNENVSGNAGYFEDEPMFFQKGMEMLIVCGERSAQRSIPRLFDGEWTTVDVAWNKLTSEEKRVVSKIKIAFVDNMRFILEAEKTDAITVTKLKLKPETYPGPRERYLAR